MPDPQKRPIICCFARKMLHWSRIKKLCGLSYVLLLQPHHNFLQIMGCANQEISILRNHAVLLLYIYTAIKENMIESKNQQKRFYKRTKGAGDR